MTDIDCCSKRALARRDRRGGRPARARAGAHRRARQEGPRVRADGAARQAARRSAQGVRPGRQRPQGARQRGAGGAQGRPGARPLSARLATEKADVTLPVRLGAAAGRPHSSGQPGVGRDRRDLRRHGLRRRRRARHRDRRSTTSPSSTSRPSIPRGRSTTPSTSSPKARRLAHGAAHAHQPRADPHHAGAEAADPHHRAGPRLSHRQRRRRTRRCSTRSKALVIDEATHLGHLKWCLEEFCKAFFEVDDVKMRFRASHFPFTEPSMEVDIDAAAIGKPGQWLEILGSGMVHPNVIAQLRPRSRASTRASPSAWASTASPC